MNNNNLTYTSFNKLDDDSENNTTLDSGKFINFLSSLTIVKIKSWAKHVEVSIPSKLRKKEMIEYLAEEFQMGNADVLIAEIKSFLTVGIFETTSSKGTVGGDYTDQDLSKQTVATIKAWAKSKGLTKLPTLRKKELIGYCIGKLYEIENGLVYPKTEIDLENLIPVYMPKEPEDYHNSQGDPFWIDHLYQHGWTVVDIPNWNEGLNGVPFETAFFDYMESFCPDFDRDDYSTWTRANMPFHLHGIYKNYFGHTAFQWKIRELCAPIFAEFWNVKVEDLLSSFGSAGLIPPTKKTKQYPNWFHSDFPREYKTSRHALLSVQGIANYKDNGPLDGGFTFIEGSVDVYNDYLEKYTSYGYKWGTVNIDDPLFQGRRKCKLCVKPGQLILFDSRIMHCNSPPLIEDSHRMCSYVCFMPRKNASESIIKRRIQAREKCRQTDHWCYGVWFNIRPEHPRRYSAEDIIHKPEVAELAELNYLCRRFVGYED